MSQTGRAEQARARADVYLLLKGVHAEPPTEDLLQFLADSGSTYLEQIFGEASYTLARFVATSFRSADICQRLRVEFDGLFRVPGPSYTAPYESVYRDGAVTQRGRLMGPSTQAVARFFIAAGLTPAKEIGGICDHLVLELELMGTLARREAAAWSGGDEEAAERARSLQKRFLSEHLVRWIGSFCDAVEEQAESDYFRGIACITRAFLATEAEAFTIDRANMPACTVHDSM